MNIAYVFWGNKPHPRRELCANSLQADFFKIPILGFHPFSSLIYSFLVAVKILFRRKYTGLFVDSGVALQTAFFVKLFSRKTKVIFYVLEPFFYNFEKLNWLMKKYYFTIIKCVDGYLTVCEMIKNEIKIYENKPVFITMPFVWRNSEDFLKLKPSKSKNFIYIKNFRDETNHNLLVDTFTEFNKKYPDSKLFIIGKKTKENVKTENKNIEVIGEADPVNYLPKAHFYIHPAFFDPGPISLIEAMLAGLVPITTEGVGNYKIVERIDNLLIIKKANKESILNAMEFVVKLGNKKISKYSIKAREIAKEFDRKRGIADFKDKFYELIRSL